MNRTPEEAKKVVAGPLGRQMEMFPLRFCKPVYFGVPPSHEHPVAVNNGTASLLDLRGDLLAVTCHHVIEGYRRKLPSHQNSAAQRADLLNGDAAFLDNNYDIGRVDSFRAILESQVDVSALISQHSAPPPPAT